MIVAGLLGGPLLVFAAFLLLGNASAAARPAPTTSASGPYTFGACTIFWTGKANDNNWSTATNWSLTNNGASAGRVPNGTDTVCMSTAPTTAQVNATTNVTITALNWPASGSVKPSLDVQGGIFTSSSGTTPPGAVVYSLSLDGGTYVPKGGTSATSIAFNSGQLGNGTSGSGTLTLVSGGTGSISQNCCGISFTGGVKLLNQGTLAIDYPGSSSFANASQLENAGTLTFADNAYLSTADGTANKVINDAGASMQYDSTDASSSVTLAVPFTNNGAVLINTASISASAGGTFGATSTVTGSGTLVLTNAGTTTAAAGANVGNLELNGATFTGAATASSYTVEGGAISKATVVTDELNLNSGSVSGPGVLTLNPGGIGQLAGDGPFSFVAGGKVINKGVMVDYGDFGSVDMNAASQFENAGTLYVEDSAYTFVNDSTACKFLNDAGASVVFEGSTAASNANLLVPFTNNGTVTVQRGTFSVQGGGTFSATSVENGPGTLVLTNGGTVAATTGATFNEVSVEGGTTLSGAATASSLRLNGGTITAKISTDNLNVRTGIISNSAIITLNAGGTGLLASSSTVTMDTSAKLINLGTMTEKYEVDFTNAAQFENGGVLNLGDHSYFWGTDGTAVKFINDAGAAVNYRGATATNVAEFNVPVTNNGSFTSTRGRITLDQLPALTAGGVLSGGTYQAQGGTIYFPVSLTKNSATLVTGTTGGFSAPSTPDALASVNNNAGTLTLGHSETFTPATFTNTGGLTVGGGTARFTAYNQTAGTTTVGSGAKLQAGAGAGSVSIAAGTLTGNGTVAGAVTGAGTVAPGRNAAAPLTISNNYTPSAGASLNISLDGGPAVGTDYGQLAVTGTANLANATLNVSLDPGTTLTNGSVFNILTAGTVSGAFAGTNGLTVGNQVLDLNASGSPVTLTVKQPPAITSNNATTFKPGSAQTFTVTTTGYPTPSLNETGTLPSGVTFTDNGDGTATLAADGTEAAGIYPFSITASAPGLAPANQSFTLDVLAFTSVTPKPIAQGVANRAVTLAGGGFLSGATISSSNPKVTFNSVVVAPDGSNITAKMSAQLTAALGNVNVTVNQPGGSVTCTACVVVQAPPTLTNVSPNTLGQGAKTVALTGTGSGFVGPVTVSFPNGPGTGVTATVTVTNATTLSIKTTVAATTPPGTYDVRIVNGNGGVAVCTGCLTVVAGPTVTSITPNSVARNTSNAPFTITGTGFSSDATVTGPTGVTYTVTSVAPDGTQISGTYSVTSTAPVGAGKSITVKNGPIGNYGSVTAALLTVTT